MFCGSIIHCVGVTDFVRRENNKQYRETGGCRLSSNYPDSSLNKLNENLNGDFFTEAHNKLLMLSMSVCTNKQSCGRKVPACIKVATR